MNKALLCAALSGLLTAGMVASATADDMGKEKCYGISKAGKNECSAADGSHACAGQSTKDNSSSDWKMVARGECVKDGGMTEPKG